MVNQTSDKRPESVLVVVYTLAGEVLMLNRIRPRGFWQSVTGSLKWGEKAPQAAERELFEETGLRASGRLINARHVERFPILPAWHGRFSPAVHYNLEHRFYFQLPTHRLITLSRSEHSQMRWLPLMAASRLASSWTNRDAILQLHQYLPLLSPMG